MGRILKSVLKAEQPESNWNRSDLMIHQKRSRLNRNHHRRPSNEEDNTNYVPKNKQFRRHSKRIRRDALDHCVDQRNYRKYLADLWVSGK